jgi:serine/threonine protein kinase
VTINTGDELDSKYRILCWLGGGGFGDVYLAEDELLKRQVAIKALKDRAADDQTGLIDEMKLLDQLHHPGIVTFYHHFVTDAVLFLVMEFCAGGSLRRRMKGDSQPLHTVMQWGADLAAVMELVHERGVVHHDIKPDNILVTQEGSLKLADFGVANSNRGTLDYLAPEMLLGEVNAGDVRVDVYALGITLLELLRNSNPFGEMNRSESLKAKLQHDFIPTDLDRWVQEVIAKATHPTPELRFQSMRDFREAIEAKHVSYVFDPGRIQASDLAAQAEKLLKRKKASAARKCVIQALHACPDCVPALIAAGRHALFINRIEEARHYFDQALRLNPRTNIQRELGWICLEQGNYAQAISLLTDHLQRNANDYEAFNLLLECFYRTERYDAGVHVARLMVDANAPSNCFVNNGFICSLRTKSTTDEIVKRLVADRRNPFSAYNSKILMEASDRMDSLLLFEGYRFGLRTARGNTIRIEHHHQVWELTDGIITMGRLDENAVHLADNSVSRRHSVVVNYLGDIWIHDLNSTGGIIVDGVKVNRKAYLDGVHIVKLGSAELKVSSSAGLLT